MSIQGQFNQALGSLAAVKAATSINKNLEESNELKKKEVAAGLQEKEVNLYGDIAQDTEAEAHSKNVLAENEKKLEDLEAAGTVTRDERGRFLKKEAREEAFNKAKEQMGYTIEMNKKSLESLQGQLIGKQKQLADIRARMKEMNVESLLGGAK